MLGSKRFTDGESRSIKDVVTFQVYPDIEVPTTMFRMCPCFIQPRQDVQNVPCAVQSESTNFDYKLPYNFGSLSYVGDYTSAAVAQTTGAFYRIYTRIVAIPPDDGGAADVAQELPNDDVIRPVIDDALDNERVRFRVSYELYHTKLMHNNKLVFVRAGGQPAIGIITNLNTENIDHHFVQLTFEDPAEAKRAHDILLMLDMTMYLVRDPDVTNEQIIDTIGQLNARIDKLPMTLFGLVSRFEDVLQMGATVTTSVMMMGRAYLLVQPDFYDTPWVPGDDIYAVLTEEEEPSSTRLFTIKYFHYHDIEKGEKLTAVVYIGRYLGTSDHAYYQCCVVTLPPCCEESIHVL